MRRAVLTHTVDWTGAGNMRAVSIIAPNRVARMQQPGIVRATDVTLDRADIDHDHRAGNRLPLTKADCLS